MAKIEMAPSYFASPALPAWPAWPAWHAWPAWPALLAWAAWHAWPAWLALPGLHGLPGLACLACLACLTCLACLACLAACLVFLACLRLPGLLGLACQIGLLALHAWLAMRQEAYQHLWSSAAPSEARPCRAKRGWRRRRPQSPARSAGRRLRRPPPKAVLPKAARPAGDVQTKARGDSTVATQLPHGQPLRALFRRINNCAGMCIYI